MDKYFLPSVYEENWYNGEATHLDGYLADRVTMLIGRPRIRQLRAVQGNMEGLCVCCFQVRRRMQTL